MTNACSWHDSSTVNDILMVKKTIKNKIISMARIGDLVVRLQLLEMAKKYIFFIML